MQNKNIIRFCFICIFFIVIANIILYRQLIVEKVILEKISTNNQLLTNTYLNYASRFCNNIFHTSDKLANTIEGCSENTTIETYSKAFFSNLDVLKVVILNEAGESVFESNKLQILPIEKTMKRAGKDIAPLLDYLVFKDLVNREKLMLNAIIIDGQDNYHNANIIVGDKELIDKKGQKYTIRYYRDISEIWVEMSLIEVKIFFAISIFFIALFIIIVYNTRFAQRIIDEQAETNKWLEVQKRKAERDSTSKSQFLANVSHELRTPLNSIIGFSEIILANKDDPKKQKANMEYVGDIYASGKHLLAVISDILDYSRVIAEELPIDIEEINVNKLASYSLRFVEISADKGNISLIKDFPKNPAIIKADSKRLRQALLNVLTNAIKFTPNGGKITLKVKVLKEKKKAQIQVIDTGIGIAKDNITKALSSFQQIDDKKDRHYEGTGLGLPLTKKLIELMKGKFEIQSKEGKGTIITFSFRVS